MTDEPLDLDDETIADLDATGDVVGGRRRVYTQTCETCVSCDCPTGDCPTYAGTCTCEGHC